MAIDSISAVILTGGDDDITRQGHSANQVGDNWGVRHQIETMKACFEEVIWVARHPSTWLELDVMIVRDPFESGHLLTNLYAGLFTARFPFVFVTTQTRPLVQPAVIELLRDTMQRRWDALLPQSQTGDDPLLAIYSKRCLKPLETLLAKGLQEFAPFLRQIRKAGIEESRLREVDSDLVSFLDLKNPKDYQLIKLWKNQNTRKHG